jgi:predicted ATPase
MRAPLYVVTGAPGAGKTTLLETLAGRGYRVLREAARELLDEEVRRGGSVDVSRRDEHDFQRRVLHRKIEVESNLDRRSTTFLDRGIPDTVAFFRLHGWNLPAQVASLVRRCDYDAVFLLEALPDVGADQARIETAGECDRLEKLLRETYQDVGAPMVILPVAPVSERADAVLAYMQQVRA